MAVEVSDRRETPPFIARIKGDIELWHAGEAACQLEKRTDNRVFVVGQSSAHAFLDEVRLVLSEHAPELARAWERAQGQVGVPAPRGLGRLVPVPLNLNE